MVSDRLELARLAYLRALEFARAQSTPASWARLLATSKNLRAAELELRPRPARSPSVTLREEQRPLRPPVPLRAAPGKRDRDEAILAEEPQ
jgi:hypothetical protein